MTQQHKFPSDWSKISNKEAVKHIKYLLEHYKEYSISIYGRNDDKIEINGISFWPMVFIDYVDNYFIVDKRKSYNIIDDTHLYHLIEQLMDVCKAEAKRRKTKERKNLINDWFEDNAPFLYISSLIGLAVCFFLTFYNEAEKQAKIENAVKQYEQTLPGYQEYQQKIANYRDSLERANR